MKKTKLLLPPMIAMEFFGASANKVQKRKNKLLEAQFEKTAWVANKELMAVIKTDGDELDSVIIAIENGNKSLISRRDVLVEALSFNMLFVAFSTMYIAKGDVEILKACGYQLSGQPKPKPVFSEPTGLRSLSAKALGNIAVKIKSLGRSLGVIYLYECAEVLPDGTLTAWKSVSWKYVTYTFTDLKPGATYQVRVGAKNKLNKVLYSATIKCVSGIGE